MTTEPEWITEAERAGMTEKWSDPDRGEPPWDWFGGNEIDFPSQRPELFDCHPEDNDTTYDPWLWDCR